MTATLPVKLGLLGSFEIINDEAQFGDDFLDVMSRTAAEGMPDEFKHIMEEALELSSPGEQIEFVNSRINQIRPYRPDMEAFNKRDHWASPQEFYDHGGDCEDFAVTKFLMLTEMGFDRHVGADNLRIVIVRDTKRKILHAICTAPLTLTYPEVMVLDNTFDIPVSHIRLMKYRPLYSFNQTRQWSHIQTNQIKAKFITQERKARGI